MTLQRMDNVGIVVASEDRRALEYGVGLTDLVPNRAASSDAELRYGELEGLAKTAFLCLQYTVARAATADLPGIKAREILQLGRREGL